MKKVKRYRLLKSYPGNTLEPGDVVSEASANRYYYSSPGKIFSVEEIENNPEYWQEIVEEEKPDKKEYSGFVQIVRFRGRTIANGYIFETEEQANNNNCELVQNIAVVPVKWYE
jgi:hypothetical protein